MNQDDQYSAILGLSFIAFSVLYFVMGAKTLDANGNSKLLILLNIITYGLFSLIHAIRMLKKTKKDVAGELEEEINALRLKIKTLDERIATSTASLREINEKIEQEN